MGKADCRLKKELIKDKKGESYERQNESTKD
jgi:hypothetical protein